MPALDPQAAIKRGTAAVRVGPQPAGLTESVDLSRLKNLSKQSRTHCIASAVSSHADVGEAVRAFVMVRAIIAASSPTPNNSDERRLRRKWTPQKYRPGTAVASASSTMGNPRSSNTGNFTQPP